MTEKTCGWTIQDGSITFFCEKPIGHKGRHGNSARSNDGRVIRISWNWNKYEREFKPLNLTRQTEKAQ